MYARAYSNTSVNVLNLVPVKIGTKLPQKYVNTFGNA